MDIISTDDPNFPELQNVEANSQVVENKEESLITTNIEEQGENTEVNTGATEADTAKDTPEDSSSEEWDGRVQYNGMDWIIDIPDEYSKELESHGIKASEVAKELYSSSDFSLTEETRAKLDAAYGKVTVDMYLNTLKQNNDNFVKNYQYEQESVKAQNQAVLAWGEEQIKGSFQDWNAFESAILSSFDDNKLEQFNAAMQSGNKMVQQYAFKAALQELQAKPNTVQPLEVGTSVPDSTGGALTAAQYSQELIKAGRELRGNRAEYARVMQQLDQRRLAGISRGI